LYRTHLTTTGSARLEIKDLRDYAVVMLNGKIVNTIDRRRSQHGCEVDVPAGGAQLDLLVENSGRINYGGKLPDNLHGITKEVTLGGDTLHGWEIYSLPMTKPSKFNLDGQPSGPSFYRGTFNVDEIGETFLDMRGWTKGVVWVNGHNLGRYWWIGPQQTLYLPSVWLKKGTNEITVFDMAGKSDPSVEGLAQPILTDLKSEPAPEKPTRNPLPTPPHFSDSSLVVSAELAPGDRAQTFKFEPRTARYLALETISTFADEDYASLSELELLDESGKSIDRSNWRIAYVDSEERVQEDGSAENLLDGDPDSIWHSVWSLPHTGNPHWVVIDMVKPLKASAVRLTPRQGDHPAKLKAFKIYFGQPEKTE
jgi:beta-galactosidase